MIGFCPLASGSKGNSIFLGTEKTKILIDAGLSGRATEKKLAQIGVKIEEIDAILISHDHSDHIQGLKVLALKRGIPVLANMETAKGIYSTLGQCPQFTIFQTGETFNFQDIEIHPFSIQHDTADPVAFTLKFDNLKLGICTDLGFPTTLVRSHLKECDYLYVEANHEPAMVHACSRPMTYKQRVLGRSGHLSNEMCADLVADVLHDGLRHIHLAHLSEECNNPDRALTSVKERINGAVPISIAPQDQIGEVIHF
ncbi:MAG: putative metallo-hydrolase YycJ [Chlamydiales bacterium]|nr:putative metallo-hydrolase YycJ [Chlamydiales bacterium]MCH9619810.1 putative metallo-hydrolase YycJ [Chlamydiales bacterium]MCH9623416.1 putative metallo-hydrolase YycJ [Chlamydiales bacterium]